MSKPQPAQGSAWPSVPAAPGPAPASAGGRFRAALAAGKAAADRRHDQRQPRADGRGCRLSRAVRFRRRRRRRSLGLPDLGINTLDDVLDRRAAHHRRAATLPLLVDVDTGFGRAFNIARTVRALCKAGAAAAAHRGPGRRQALRPPAQQGDRAGRGDGRPRQGGGRRAHRCPVLRHLARTDALAGRGPGARRSSARFACVAAGADRIFAEAVRDLDTYRRFTAALPVPVLANLTEFGQTPLFTLEELRGAASPWRCIRCRRFAR